MSDTDLQQYNGTPNFPATADVGTNADTYLLPTDGPFVTADANMGGDAPVNRALKIVGDKLLGLRDAIVGDRGGAQRYTLAALDVDGTGGVPSALTPGEIQALGNITSTNGDITASLGSVTAKGNVEAQLGNITADLGYVQATAGSVYSGDSSGTTFGELFQAFVRFLGTGTGSGDANPPQGTAIPNQLRAKNIPKCSAFIEIQAGTVTLFEGFGISAAIVNGGSNRVDIAFATPFDNARFSVKLSGWTVGGSFAIFLEDGLLRTAGSIAIAGWELATSTPITMSTATLSISLDVDGQQTT